MRNELDKVQSFLDKFQVETSQKPHYIDPDLLIKRCNHLMEELKELAYTYSYIQKYDSFSLEKWTRLDIRLAPLEEVLDALIDIQYLVLGTALMHGFGNVFEEAFEKVHQANMAKILVKSADHKLGILKPVNWQKPNLKELIDGI